MKPTPPRFITSFADDAKHVFINGKHVAEAAGAKTQVEFPLSSYAQQGVNAIEIAYELFGSPNFGDKLGEFKGIESVGVGADANSGTPIENWQVQLFPAAMRGREVDPGFPPGGQSVALSASSAAGASSELVPAFTWCRAEFNLALPPEEWSIAWKLTFEAGTDALIYLNGKFVGRYATAGPQRDFYLPAPYLVFDSKRKNVLTIVLAYTDRPQSIRTLRVGPYEEYATRRTRVEFEW